MRDKPKEFSGNIPWCRIEDIEGNYFNGTKSNQYVSQSTIDNMNLKIIPTGSVICSCSASLGTYAINTCPIITNQTFIGLVCSEKISNHFLLNLMCTQTKKLKVIAGGTTIPYISREKFEEYDIKIPNKNEQEKIGIFLSLIDKRIEKQRQLVESLKKYKRGVLYNIFINKYSFKNNEFWTESKLKKVCNCFDNQRKPISSELREKGHIPYYGANGIQDYVKNHIFDGDFVLLAEDGGHFDDFSTMPIAQFISGKSWVNNHARILQGKSGYNTKFIYYSLVHKDIRKYINGTSRAKLNQEDMWDIKIDVPNIDMQEKIVKYFSTFDLNIKNQESILQKLEILKKGLLQHMFI